MSIVTPLGTPMPLSAGEAFSMAGKVVIVTGAGGNVGSAIAEVFAVNDAAVVVSDLPGERITRATDTLRGHDKVHGIACDLTKPDELSGLIEQTVAKFSRIDAIINCGAVPASGPITEEDASDFDRLYQTNVRAPWLLTKHAIPHMRNAGGGSIVNISSINGHRAVFFCSLYTGTKAALMAMTRELAVELAPYNIRVNSVSPGVIPNTNHRLDWTKRFLREPYATQIAEEFRGRMENDPVGSQPLRMVGHGHDIAMACYYLCSPAARFVTGIDITVDGGKLLEMHEAEPRFYQGRMPYWKEFRLRLLELPDEAWQAERPKWLQRFREAQASGK